MWVHSFLLASKKRKSQSWRFSIKLKRGTESGQSECSSSACGRKEKKNFFGVRIWFKYFLLGIEKETKLQTWPFVINLLSGSKTTFWGKTGKDIKAKTTVFRHFSLRWAQFSKCAKRRQETSAFAQEHYLSIIWVIFANNLSVKQLSSCFFLSWNGSYKEVVLDVICTNILVKQTVQKNLNTISKKKKTFPLLRGTAILCITSVISSSFVLSVLSLGSQTKSDYFCLSQTEDHVWTLGVVLHCWGVPTCIRDCVCHEMRHLTRWKSRCPNHPV